MATRSRAARAGEDDVRRRQARLEWEGTCGGQHSGGSLATGRDGPRRAGFGPNPAAQRLRVARRAHAAHMSRRERHNATQAARPATE